MLTMMRMTMTMITVGRRYEYTRSNDRMWRKNTVDFPFHDDNEDIMNITFCFLFYMLLFSGSKPWLVLHWSWFESQLSWRVRLQLWTILKLTILKKNTPRHRSKSWQYWRKTCLVTDTVLEPRVTLAVRCSRDLTHSVKRSQGRSGWQKHMWSSWYSNKDCFGF